MCGIAGIHRRTDAPMPKMGRLANELLLANEGRGPDSTGYLVMLDSGKVQIEKAAVTASTFVKRRKSFSEDARTVLLHTRYATRGKVTQLNAHPQISGRCAAVHNGTIYNADELFKTFGLKRRATVDSEIVPALIDHAGWDEAGAALELMTGGAAVAVVNADHPREVILARTESYPLVYLATEDFVVWASTEKAIVQAWRFAYGTTPPRGEWGMLGPWSMMRVNGELSMHWLDPVVPVKPKASRASAKGKARKARKAATRKTAASATVRPSGRTRRPKAGRNTSGPRAAGESLSVAQPWQEDDPVLDVMRWTGMSYRESHEAVYGETIYDELATMMRAERG